MASQRAPLDLWTGADTGLVRPALLRAHPLLNDGVISFDRLGRRLVHATLEFERPFIDPASAPRGSPDAFAGATAAVVWRSLATVKWAAFADAARVFHRLAGDGRTQVDIGVGLRVRLAATPAALRLDLARGLRDGRMVLSAGWQAAWPGW